MNPDDVDDKLTLGWWSSHSLGAETFHNLVSVDNSLPCDLREESDGFSCTSFQEKMPNWEAFPENPFNNGTASEWISEMELDKSSCQYFSKHM